MLKLPALVAVLEMVIAAPVPVAPPMAPAKFTAALPLVRLLIVMPPPPAPRVAPMLPLIWVLVAPLPNAPRMFNCRVTVSPLVMFPPMVTLFPELVPDRPPIPRLVFNMMMLLLTVRLTKVELFWFDIRAASPETKEPGDVCRSNRRLPGAVHGNGAALESEVGLRTSSGNRANC